MGALFRRARGVGYQREQRAATVDGAHVEVAEPLSATPIEALALRGLAT